MSFSNVLSRDARLIQARLDLALADRADLPVVRAMRYAVQGGKRLRGFLVLESARMLGVAEARAISAAAAIEALHAYSLIHDDLPCMDDDDLRRGQPTVHVQWDEATRSLSGQDDRWLCPNRRLGPLAHHCHAQRLQNLGLDLRGIHARHGIHGFGAGLVDKSIRQHH